jgi:hypothetical protein
MSKYFHNLMKLSVKLTSFWTAIKIFHTETQIEQAFIIVLQAIHKSPTG